MKQNDIQRPGSLIKATLISSLAAPLPFVVTILANLILSEDFQVPELTQLFGFLLIIMLFALPFTCTINFVLVISEEHTSELQSRLHIVCRLMVVRKHRI